MTEVQSKLDLGGGKRIAVSEVEAKMVVAGILTRLGNSADVSAAVAGHLADASLSGVESHGVMRVLEYACQMRSGYMTPGAEARVTRSASGATVVDGGGGIGIPAMQLAYCTGIAMAAETGISALAVRNTGHTGRHGAFAEEAAERGCLTICAGGGNRHVWPQVAPYGGSKGLLPTNPWCIGIPGGARGPVVLDFATSKIAGGWIYAAQSAGARLPEGCVIDRHGNPTRDPADYFSGGAILPAGGHKGYALALMGEMIGEALLGPSTTECNWLLITVKCSRFREDGPLQAAAEEVLSEIRACPPAEGFSKVEVPGERERECRRRSAGIIRIPEATWGQITDLARQLGG
jgi:LDH2 family malate/lactate/ureidoglycolate dehydrogenase